MNLSMVQVDLEIEPQQDLSPNLRAEEARLVKIIEALGEVKATKGWGSLKTEVFEHLAEVLERELKDEAKQKDPSSNKLNRLTGQLMWAEKYASLDKLENMYRVQLQNVRLKLHGKTQTTG